MAMGITYDGEIGRAGASNDPQKAVEIVCTDPRFVEIASAKKPNFIIRLFNGALSFPRDWWYGATFISTRFGLFGAEGKAATDGTAHTMSNLIEYALANKMFTLRVIRTVLGHLLHYPELYARQGTALGAGIASGVILGLGTPFTFTAGIVNFVLATVGAIARAVDNGATTLAEIIVAAAIGESDPAVAHTVSEELRMIDPENDDYDISAEDEAYLLYVLKGVLHCLRNPGMYSQSGQGERGKTVPVGRVSSARPRGVMGSIPVGHEYNALDAISEDNRYLRRE